MNPPIIRPPRRLRRLRRVIACSLLVLCGCSGARVSGPPVPAGGGSSPASAPAPGGGGPPAVPPPAFVLPDAGPFDGAAATPAPATCGFQKHVLDRLSPELLLLLDRSSSMNQGLSLFAPETRWAAATAAVLEVLRRTNGNIFWGLKNFPDPEGCEVLPQMDVPIGMVSQPVIDAIMTTMPNGGAAGTPTGRVIEVGVQHLRSRTTRNPKYLVLATDGLPTCPDIFQGEQTSLDAISAANQAGFPTFVIGIATDDTEAEMVLNRLAMAGGRPRPGTSSYYPANDRQGLVDALGQIARTVETCTFPLDRDAPSPEDVAVNVDGMRIMRDPSQMNGWNYGPNNRVINLYGPACDRVKSGSVASLEIIFGCPHVPIP
jgi:hypothetical protein